MQDSILDSVKDMIRAKTGIIINTENGEELSLLTEERMRVLQLPSSDYLRHLESNRDEVILLASRFTVQETTFYRYREHFDRLKLQILPELIRKKQQAGDRRLLIISAGCATGEEPYTIAMIVHDLLKDREEWDVRIVASDINAEALQKAREGVYSDYRLRNIDQWYVYRYFDSRVIRANTSQHRIKGFIKDMVEFRQVNLIQEPFPLAELTDADVILCENVIIYFCMESIQKLINHFFEILAPEGFLLLGPSETLNIIAHRFELSWWNESFAYRKPVHEATVTKPVLGGNASPRQAAAGGIPPVMSIPYPEMVYLILQNFETEKYDEAAALMHQAEQSGQELNDIFHIIKAEYLYENRDYMAAANECRKAISLNQKSKEAHVLLGVIYMDIGMFDNAHFELSTALYYEPECALCYYYLGQYFLQTGNNTEHDYCLAFAKHLAENRESLMTGKTFPLYRSRREKIHAAIKQAPSHPAVPDRNRVIG